MNENFAFCILHLNNNHSPNSIDLVDRLLHRLDVGVRGACGEGEEGAGVIAARFVRKMLDVDASFGDRARDLGDRGGDVCVENKDVSAAVRGQIDRGKVDGIADIARLEELNELICRHNGAVVLALTRRRTEMRNIDDTLDA